MPCSYPVRDTTPIKAKPKSAAQPLDAVELGRLRAELLSSQIATDLDVTDLVHFLISHGLPDR